MACQQLLEIVKNISDPSDNKLRPDSDVVCLARVGTDTQNIVTVSLEQGSQLDMGAPLHSMVIPGDCHFLEQDCLNMWRSWSLQHSCYNDAPILDLSSDTDILQTLFGC